MSGVIASLLPSVDAILGIRDSIGAVIDTVYLYTRTWSGSTVGAGTPTDTKTQMLPSPCLKNYAQDLRLKEGGEVKAGDIILKSVSQNSYTEANLDGSSAGMNIEKFFLVGNKLYQVINVKKRYVTWDVQIRMLSNQERHD